MAKKATKKETEAKVPSKDDVVLHALSLAKTLGWNHVRMQDIADEAGVSLSVLYGMFEDKSDILVTLGRRIDRQVLEAFDTLDPSLSERDRLFDIMMERFDVLGEYREGVVAIVGSFRYDPKQAVISCPHLCRSMAWMLEAAGLDTNGFRGALKVAGLTGLYLKVLRVWKDDDSPDLSKTMAALDKDLGRIERFATTFGF